MPKRLNPVNLTFDLMLFEESHNVFQDPLLDPLRGAETIPAIAQTPPALPLVVVAEPDRPAMALGDLLDDLLYCHVQDLTMRRRHVLHPYLCLISDPGYEANLL